MLTQTDISQLRRLMELRDKRDRDKASLKKSEEAYRDAEADLYERLTDADAGAIGRIPPVDLGPPWGRVSFGARETYFGRIIAGKEDEALKYFEQRAMVDEVSAPKFVMKRVNEIVRDAVEQGDLSQLPPGVDFYANRGVTITRQKGS